VATSETSPRPISEGVVTGETDHTIDSNIKIANTLVCYRVGPGVSLKNHMVQFWNGLRKRNVLALPSGLQIFKGKSGALTASLRGKKGRREIRGGE